MAAKCPETDKESNTGSDSDKKPSVLSYVKGSSDTPFDIWLSNHLPSQVRRADGYDYVVVNTRKYIVTGAGPHDSWQEHLPSNKPVTYKVIKALAEKHHVLSGKWMFFTDQCEQVDHLWTLIASAVIKNDIVCFSAKVSTCKDKYHSHAICVYNEDFTNMKEVSEAEKAIRNLGIKETLFYKPDVYTKLGLYGRSNVRNIKPSIMISNFNLNRGSSEIRKLV